MPDIRLIALDLDGTLLDDEKQVPPENIEALQAAEAAGVHVVLCTGRMIPNTERTVDQLGLDPVVAGYNGAKMVDRRAAGRTVLHHRPVAAERAEPIVRLAAERGWLLNFYHEDRLYAQPNEAMSEHIDLYHRRGGVPYEFVHHETLVGRDATKLIIIADPAQLPAIEVEVGPSVAGLNTIRTDPEYLEIMAPEVHKGVALEAFARHFGIEVEQCLAVGDSGNDVEMLEAAGIGVAVGNAREDVKAVADLVVEETNEEAAVARIVERLIFGR